MVETKTPITAPPEKDLQRAVKDIVERFQNFIALAIALGIVMIGAGYVVVNSHLWRYTRQHGYALNQNRHFTAGTMLVLFMIVLFILLYVLIALADRLIKRDENIRDMIEHRWFYPFWIVVSLISGVVAFALFGQLSAVTLVMMTVLAIAMRNILGNALKDPLSRLGGVVFVGLLLYAAIGSFIFGRSVYWRIPHSLGGGQPPVVQLIFASSELLSALQLPPADGSFTDLSLLQMPAPSDTITDRLCLLSETYDGVLVYNPQNRTTLSIKHESLLSIRDAYRTLVQINDDQKTFNCAPPQVSNDLFGGLVSILGDDIEAIGIPSEP